MKISVTIGKTVQEQQYEPYHVELSASKEVKEKDQEDEFETMYTALEETLDNFIEDRLNNR